MLIRIKKLPDGRAYILKLKPGADAELIIRVYCERDGRFCKPMADAWVRNAGCDHDEAPIW